MLISGSLKRQSSCHDIIEGSIIMPNPINILKPHSRITQSTKYFQSSQDQYVHQIDNLKSNCRINRTVRDQTPWLSAQQLEKENQPIWSKIILFQSFAQKTQSIQSDPGSQEPSMLKGSSQVLSNDIDIDIDLDIEQTF